MVIITLVLIITKGVGEAGQRVPAAYCSCRLRDYRLFGSGICIDDCVRGCVPGRFVLVNFLNPFAAEKSNETKQLLLKHLEFVSSGAARHRRMSQLELENYGEYGEWALLETWVMKRRGVRQ